MTDVLLATVGGSWQVVPEIYGFTNYEQCPLYRDARDWPQMVAARQRHALRPVDEIWVVTTAGARVVRERLQSWCRLLESPPAVRVWWPQEIEDLRDDRDVRQMAELIHRLVFHSYRRAGPGGRVILCLAGGRKTMSADLQRAGEAFGWHALLHVIDRLSPEDARGVRELSVDSFARPLSTRWCDLFLPVVVSGSRPASDTVSAKKDEIPEFAGPLPEVGPVAHGDSTPLLDFLERCRREAGSLLLNFRLQLSREGRTGAFRALYGLPVRIVKSLQERKVGAAPENAASDLAWIQSLPKAELHCHLGGILSPGEMVYVAEAEAERVAHARKRSAHFDRALAELEAMVAAADEGAIARFLSDAPDAEEGPGRFKALRRRWPDVKEPLSVCGFLLAFREATELLERVIYRDLLDPRRFFRQGIRRYEALGDLQGSGVLQSEPTLLRTMATLSDHCRRENITYLELRCSPGNYCRGGLTERRVAETLVRAAGEIAHCDIRLILTASRHRELAATRRHVKLASQLLEKPDTARRLVGFDLAGAECEREARDFRAIFRSLHRRVVRLTIHAGEDRDVESVWQAVYELNADRVGHGLTLSASRELLGRFRDRQIAIEMCPSSNYQIVGFNDYLIGPYDNEQYPMKHYLDSGLRVTINTDDPGISRTTLSREYLKAAAMTRGGLSRWEVLQLVRNGFRAAFCGHEERHEHLVRAEERIVEGLQEES